MSFLDSRARLSLAALYGHDSAAGGSSLSHRPGRGDALLSLVGNTPLIPLRFEPEGLTVWAKCEFLNPSGSVKDRFAANVIREAERSGALQPDSIILECSSGNTGIALAMMGAARGYRTVILLSEGSSPERRRLIQQYGGELMLFTSEGNYERGIEITRQMAAADARYFLPSQFDNPLNSKDHERTTGREILLQVPGRVDAFVNGYGTGGTLAGCGRAIKRANPNARIVAMEPAKSALLSGEAPCCHLIEGVSDGYVPALLKDAPVDESRKVDSTAALFMTRRLHKEFGLLVGTSSGANVLVALEVARELGPDANVVTLLCDRADRYFSTALFDHEVNAPPSLAGGILTVPAS